MKTNRRESAVMAGVKAYLDTRTDCLMWRNNSGGAFVEGAFLKFGKRGSGDWLGLQARPFSAWVPTGLSYPVEFLPLFIGRFVAIECKRERGGVQTEDQRLFQRNVVAHGGLYIVARSVDDVAQGLGPALVHIVKERRKRVIPR